MAQWNSYLFLILLYAGHFNVIDSVKTLHTLNQQRFINILQSGKTSLIYFRKTTNPSIRLFLQQLEKSSESLEEYGITVAQVNCATEKVPKYCENEDALKKAYLFRGNIMLRSFATDTLFDVDAIIANVLFILLFNEIKYVASLVDLHDIENDMKGRGDVIFTFVRAIGVPEHRAIMETAFVYGAKYQFVLTTEQSVLEGMDLEDPDKLSARLWFCHCKMAVDRTQPCKRSYFNQPLTTVNIHYFLKVLEAPLVTEVTDGPEKVSTVHVQLKMPVVFLFTQRETYEHDRITAESVAWQLLGRAGVVLVPRTQLQPNVPADVTVGYRAAGGDSSINYLVITSVEEIVDLIKGEVKNESTREKDDEEENEDVDFTGIQDDEVAETVYRARWRGLDVNLVPALTDSSFPTRLAATLHVVVLFYTAWDAVSMAFFQSYAEVSTRCAVNDAFIEAAHFLRGTVVLGLYAQKDAIYLSQKFGVALPALVFVRDEDSHIEGIHLENSSTEDIVTAVKSAMLEKFPEVTVENFPSYFHPQKPLLILFIDNDDTKTLKAREELAEFTKLRSVQIYTTCWIDLRNTHVGKEILQIYLNYLPQLPALILVHLSSSGQVFVFPEGQLISRMGVLQWLKKVQTGEEHPNNLLQAKDWTPPQTTYDFLAIMDIVRPGFAKQRTSDSAKRENPYAEEENETEHVSEINEEEDHREPAAESEKMQGTPKPLDKEKKMQHEFHNEL
ncbi:thioredoxin domain-containing protein 16 isoform X5 [Heterodontus francisci]|uniref:thioredoxin domain-containing protein 16 isoform X5 n=1 Tax=Heterodontus francisci TaxID=7792 RepID=UPI00355BE01F